MISVFVVEDESLLRRNIINLINQSDNELTVIGSAGDGQSAFEQISTLKPDLLFTDIRMPVMDGLTLISKLKKLDLSTIPIILSGYNEFDYAQQAIKLGVVDYLLKPFTPDSLNVLLADLLLRVKTVKKEKETGLLNDLFFNKNLYEFTPLPDFLNAYSTFCYLHVCSGSYLSHPANNYSESIMFWDKISLFSILQKYIAPPSSFWTIDGKLTNEKFIVIGLDKNITVDSKLIIKNIYDDLTSHAMPITLLYNITNDIKHFTTLINNSKNSMRKYVIYSQSTLLENNQNKQTLSLKIAELYADSQTELIYCVKTRNAKQLKKIIKKMLSVCEKSNCLQQQLDRLFKLITIDLFNELTKISTDDFYEIEMRFFDYICTETTYESLTDNIFYLIDDLFECIKSEEEKSDTVSLINAVEQYIMTHYNTNITLQSLSKKYGFVSSYLSHLYKSQKGITPSEHITKLRIEKAKQLLITDPTLLLKDISKQIGYDDPFYFSRVFKSLTSCSPTEFKKRTHINQ